MSPRCPSCSASLPPSAIADALAVARCPSCRAVVDLQVHASAPRGSSTVAIPEGWSVDDAGDGLRIRWSMRSAALFFLIPFTIFWNGFLVFFGLGMSDGFAHPERLVVGLVVPHVWVGVGLAYFCLASLVNTKSVGLEGGMLRVTNGPVPMPGRRNLPTSEIDQLFVVEKRKNKGGTTYDLCALQRDGRRATVVEGLQDAVDARFLEVRIEQALRIRDVPVEGELRRG